MGLWFTLQSETGKHYVKLVNQNAMDGSKLVIVESPTKANTIGRYLGNDYVVKSSRGHIRDLQDKSLSIDVEHGFAPEYVIPDDKKRLVAELRSAAAKASSVLLASDEDREGEAISWHLFQTLGLKRENTRRIVFHEITKDAILSAIEHPRDIDMNLVNAQQARRVLDRLVGFELSPILWRKIQPRLSAGRVQSVALRLIVDREKEIMAFNSEPFWRVDAVFHPEGHPAAVKVKAVLDKHFDTLEDARTFLEDSIGASFSIASLDRKEGVRFPAPPFTTSTLQQEAARKLHFPVGVTMRIAQQLYERGLITYMRTDSTNLSGLALGTAKKFITEHYGADYAKTRQYKTHSKGAQEAHEAIRPTFIENVQIEGSAQEQKLYNLIWKRTVASQMADAKVLGITLKIASDKRPERFSVQATQVLFDGFLKLYMDGPDEESATEETLLPNLEVGDRMEEKGISASCKFTQAPQRYSEGTLVKKLEELGIGRPSTYGPTIATLTTGRGYVFKGDKEGVKKPVTNLQLKGGKITVTEKTETVGAERGKLIPHEIGMIVVDYLAENFSDIMDYEFTANVEKDFDDVAAGEQVWNEMIGRFYTPFHQRVEEVMHDGRFSHVSRDLGTDPEGRTLQAKYGKFGPYIQRGEGEGAEYASLARGQLIENITLEEAIQLFRLPRTVGQVDGVDVIATKGRFGPYLKYGDRNISLPRNADPLKVTLEECTELIRKDGGKASANAVLKAFETSGLQVIDGRYGPYIKYNGANYRIPKGTDVETLTEEACLALVQSNGPTRHTGRRNFRKR